MDAPDPDLVGSLDELAGYLKELSLHFETQRDEWQNWTAGDYLESIAAWLDEPPTLPEARAERDTELGGQRPTWRGVAMLFEIGRIYE